MKSAENTKGKALPGHLFLEPHPARPRKTRYVCRRCGAASLGFTSEGSARAAATMHSCKPKPPDASWR